MQISSQPYPYSAKTLQGYGKIVVGVTAIPVNFSSTVKNITISADKDNTGILYVGNSTVTSAGANAFTYLGPGDVMSLDYDDITSKLYIVSTVAAQAFWLGGLS
ncbi:MAG: hypothetical protein WCO30_01715 [bacterium]